MEVNSEVKVEVNLALQLGADVVESITAWRSTQVSDGSPMYPTLEDALRYLLRRAIGYTVLEVFPTPPLAAARTRMAECARDIDAVFQDALL